MNREGFNPVLSKGFLYTTKLKLPHDFIAYQLF